MQQRVLALMISATMTIGSFLHAQSSEASAGRADILSTGFIVGPRFVHVPKGVFLLVRRGREIGAIRFTRIEPSGGIGQGSSTYESYFQGDGSGSFQTVNVMKLSGVIDIKPIRGVSHSLSWQPGSNKLRVGRWWFGCLSIDLINMSPHFFQYDQGYEFAPTSAHEITEVDASAMGLKWFRYDANSSIKLSLAVLPK